MKKITPCDKPIAMILGKYTTSGLGVARSLGRNNIPVVWLDSNANQAGFLSIYCHGLHCPPSHEQKNYIKYLTNLGKTLIHKAVLFPIGDQEVEIILTHQQQLTKYFLIPQAPLDITNILLDKKTFYQNLEKLKILHPKTYYPANNNELCKISKTIDYPCIIKPANSVQFREHFNTKFFEANNSHELINKYNQATTKQPVMIQELIPGDPTHMYGCNAYYDTHHKHHGMFMYQRIREWPPTKGNGIYIKNTYIPEIETILNTLLNKIKYHGIIDAEFKKDPRTNQYHLIEINPRSWMQISFPTTQNINIPLITYQDACGIPIPDKTQTPNSKKWIFVPHDLRATWKKLQNHTLTLSEWFQSLKGPKEYAIYAKDDPLPFFRYIISRNSVN